MVYTSDLRGKHILRDLHNEILSDLKELNLDDKLLLRIFDDSQEDDKLWSKGGLTFNDPDTQKPFGSNDAAWYIVENNNPEPLVVVEETFGTERGQFGDGQFNRFSHPLAPAKLGYTGVMLVPYKGESYSKSDGVSGKNEEFASVKYAYLNKTIVKTALGVSESEKGEYLIIDFYDIGTLKKLIIEKFKEKVGLDSSLEDVISKIKEKMSNYAFQSADPRNKIKKIYDSNGDLMSDSFGYIFTQNFDAFTTSSKRDGHGTFGKILSLPYLWYNEKMYAIFLRLDKKAIQELKKRQSKEVDYIFNNPKVTIVSRDNLLFDDGNLKKQLEQIENVNLFQHRQTTLIKNIRNQIEIGKIKIKF